MSRHGKGKYPKPKRPKTKLGLPDLDHSKSESWTAFVLPSPSVAIDTPLMNLFSGTAPSRDCRSTRLWSPRYRIFLENRQLAAGTINGRLAAVRRLAYEAADAGLLSPELGAGIQRVKGAKKLGVRLGNWLTAEEARRFWQSPAQTHSKESGTVRFSPCCWVADSAAANWLIWTSRIL